MLIVFQRIIRTVIIFLCFILFFQIFPPPFEQDIRGNTQKTSETVIVMDISKSMETDDITPSRITFAKGILLDLIAKVEHLGVIIFA
jgi:hypothetical protein